MRFSTLAFFATSAGAQCSSSSSPCEPVGATSLTPPQIQDSNFASLYKDLLGSSLPSFKSKRSLSDPISELEERQSSTGSSLCCITSLSCLLVSNLNIPFCYDRFTTNYFLPDSSFGTLSSGAYTSSSGSTANFQTGNFTLKDGTTGNIYPAGSAEKSSVATLSLPPQFTGIGVGSAIPASALGGVVVRTFTRTLQATTIPGTTITGGVSTVTESGGSVRTTSLAGSTVSFVSFL